MHTTDTHVTRLSRLGTRVNDLRAQLDDAREARDAAIEAANLAGLSVREIARAAGIAPRSVQVVIITRTAARQARLTRPTSP